MGAKVSNDLFDIAYCTMARPARQAQPGNFGYMIVVEDLVVFQRTLEGAPQAVSPCAPILPEQKQILHFTS